MFTLARRDGNHGTRDQKKGDLLMGGIIYLVGLVVVVMAVLSLIGLG